MYADVDEKTGETLQITKPIPLPALNVRHSHFSWIDCEIVTQCWNAEINVQLWAVYFTVWNDVHP